MVALFQFFMQSEQFVFYCISHSNENSTFNWRPNILRDDNDDDDSE